MATLTAVRAHQVDTLLLTPTIAILTLINICSKTMHKPVITKRAKAAVRNKASLKCSSYHTDATLNKLPGLGSPKHDPIVLLAGSLYPESWQLVHCILPIEHTLAELHSCTGHIPVSTKNKQT